MAYNRRAKNWNNVKNLFALIIGIDDYPHATKLKGARDDGDRFASFLQQQVHVESNRIINLRNEGATRAKISEAFRSLWEHKSIRRGDSIVIYFAGHGCKIRRPSGWETGGRDVIEGIFPYDVEPDESNARTIFPIPDRTIGIWLDILSYEKGNNITVIFDCCHSASGARAYGEELVRAQEFHGIIPDRIDDESFVVKVPLEFLYQQSRSHVFLAACGATEYAREEAGKGKFTEELLKALKLQDADNWSYVEFMKRMKPIARQTPQCEGHFKNRTLFSNYMKIGRGIFGAGINSNSKLNQKAYCIDAGSIHGVDENSIFDFYETAAIDTQTTGPVCRLRAKVISPLHTTAVIDGSETETRMSKSGFVRQVRSGKPLKVYFSPSFLRVVNEPRVIHRIVIAGRVEVVEGMRNADFVVDAEGQNAIFTTNMKCILRHGFSRFPDAVQADAEHVSRVLLAASRWKQHLDISTSSAWINNIHVEFFPLEPVYDQTGSRTLKRMGTSRLNNEDNIVFLDVQPKNNEFYGMVLQNNTDLDLHVTIVSFNTDNLKFEPYFSGAIGVDVNGDADPLLLRRNRLTIGYGSSGGLPFMFDAPKDGGNVTILKLYLTTMPLDLGWLTQDSPFSDDIPRSARSLYDVQKVTTSVDPGGATKLVTIAQRAYSPAM